MIYTRFPGINLREWHWYSRFGVEEPFPWLLVVFAAPVVLAAWVVAVFAGGCSTVRSRPLGPTTPSVGRIVHIAVGAAGGVIPAIVTHVYGGSVHDGIAATSFPVGEPPGVIVAEHVEPTAAVPFPPAGTWHWPTMS